MAAAIVAALVLLVHPVKVLSEDSYSYHIYITGTTTPMEALVPMSGGLRAYLDEDNYIWFSLGDYEQDDYATPFGVHWNFFWEKPTIQSGRE